MMFGSTTRSHLSLLAVLALMSVMAPGADAVSVFRKSSAIELGNVYDSEHTVLTSLVVSNGHCGLICDELGDDQCQSFNVKPEGDQIRCEMFDHLPREVASIVPHPTGQLFEEECESFKVTAGVKAMHGAIDTVTLVDDNRAVYRLTSTSPRPRFIGSVEEVFVDFNQRIDDMIFKRQVHPFGDIYMIRYGKSMHCYKSANKEHKKFVACETDNFPTDFDKVLPVMRSDTWRLAVNTGDSIISLWDNGITKTSYAMNSVSTGAKDLFQLLGTEDYRCDLNPRHSQFCSVYMPFWLAASGGIYLNGDQLGLFIGTKMYTFDKVKDVVRERYAMCKNKNLLFLF